MINIIGNIMNDQILSITNLLYYFLHKGNVNSVNVIKEFIG